MPSRRACLRLAPLLALALAGCVASPPAPGPAAARWERESAAIDSLAAAGRLDSALALARMRVHRENRVPAAHEPAWHVREAVAIERSLQREAALPGEARAALAAAAWRARDTGPDAAGESLAVARDRDAELMRARAAALGPRDVRTADAALALASREFEFSRVRAADSLAAAARDAYRDALGADHPRVADAEELLGQLQKNFSGRAGLVFAERHYLTALRIRIAAFGPTALPVAESYQDLGNLYRMRREIAVAVGLLGAALDIRRAAHGPVHDEVGSTLASLAFLEASEGHWAAAEALARAAVEATPARTGRPTGDRSMRLGLQGRMLLRMGRTTESLPPLREAAALRESVWERGPRDQASSVMAGLALHRDVALALALEGRGDEAFDELARGQSRTLSGKWYDPDARVPDPWRGLLPQVRARLRPDEALVTWVRATTLPLTDDDPILACVVRADGPLRWMAVRHVVPITPHLGTIRDVYWHEMRNASAWPRRVEPNVATASMASGMGREWFAPVEAALAGVTRLVVCGPDLFAGGPLGALRDSDGRWLADRYVISYTPSALLFVHDRENARPAGAARGRPALLVGDPAYSPADPGRWSRLPGAGDEIRALAARLPSATVLSGADASAARLRSLADSGALARFGVLHFAGHAAIDARGALESALVLAPDSAAGTIDSRMRAREIADHWRLDADLVSLAACRSVEGMQSASEGWLGLNEAFLTAGARSLLVTLWPVDDGATSFLMQDFYARLADRAHPVDRAEALRGAQRTLREWRAPDGTRPYAHPAYWAAFVLIGDPG